MIRTGLLAAVLFALGAGAVGLWSFNGGLGAAAASAEEQEASAQSRPPTCAPPPQGATADAGSSGQWLIDAGARAKLADGDSLPDDPDAARVVVDFDGSVFWGKALVSLAELRDAVSRHTRDDPARPIRVEWHRLAKRGYVSDVVAAINAAGPEPILVEGPPGPPPGPPVIVRADGSQLVGYTQPAADMPALVRMLQESYPPAAAQEQREGDATVSMCISAGGQARNVRLVRSSGHADLDEAAVKGMTSIRFHPACDPGGKPVDWCSPPLLLTINWRAPQ